MAADATREALPLVVSGVASAIVSQLHLTPEELFYAFCGAAVGLVLSKRIRRLHALAIFPFVVLLAARIGTWIAATNFPGDALASGAVCGALGLFAHPLTAMAIRRIDPKFADQMEAQQ